MYATNFSKLYDKVIVINFAIEVLRYTLLYHSENLFQMVLEHKIFKLPNTLMEISMACQSSHKKKKHENLINILLVNDNCRQKPG